MTPAKIFTARPYLSLLLLIITYFNFGWVLYRSGSDWWAWLIVGILILAIDEAMAAPLSIIRYLSGRLLNSDTKAFFTVFTAAFIAMVLLTWINFSAHALILVAATALARLDLQYVAIKEFRAFLTLSFFSFLGLGLGTLFSWAFRYYPILELFQQGFKRFF